MNYDFEKGEPAILVEIFLPYRAQYQGALYKALEEGLQLRDIDGGYASHFSGERIEEIKKMLQKFGINDNFDKFIKRNTLLFNGYSTYEVHGVFRGNNHKLIEEQTTVIRIIFIPNYNELTNEINEEFLKIESTQGFTRTDVTEEFLSNLFRIALRNSYRDSQITPVIEYTALAPTYKNMDPKQREHCINVVQGWVEDVGIFLFGYIVFKLADGVEENEEEIWVTSHWNFYVNRIIRKSI